MDMTTPPLYRPRDLLNLPADYTVDQARHHYHILLRRYTASDTHTRTVRRLIKDAYRRLPPPQSVVAPPRPQRSTASRPRVQSRSFQSSYVRTSRNGESVEYGESRATNERGESVRRSMGRVNDEWVNPELARHALSAQQHRSRNLQRISR